MFQNPFDGFIQKGFETFFLNRLWGFDQRLLCHSLVRSHRFAAKAF